ncbi:MAG: 30S ribosome-binding factor RbfA [SAR324 cluster bacterium]|nr:30S ribosome-binding factor RbfA [SAR324 cluster bacterium]
MRKSKGGIHNALIHRKLSEILLRESKDPRFERVTISRVEAVKGLSLAQIYFSIYPPENIEELTESLNHAAGFFSNCLGHALKTRNTPRLIFIYDKGFDYSSQIDTLIKNVSEDDS